MSNTDRITEMLAIASRINDIVAEMKARKEQYLAEQMPKAA
ncbi:hypothetical protein ACPH3Q_003714 [Cronobacter sakazakii]|nr:MULTISPECIES: hypothetical protein [Cronobacter]MDT3563826.1 hypothetical protein [Cronobacter malonaticus]